MVKEDEISSLNLKLRDLKLKRASMLVKNRNEFPRQYLCRQLKNHHLDSLAVEQHSKRVNDRRNSIAVEQHSKMVNGRLDNITTEDNYVTAMQSKLRKIFELQETERRLISLGFIFSPEEGLLIHHYLRENAAGNVWYFLTCANGTRPGTDIQGRWIFEKEMDVFYQGEKAGVKQLLQYCELDRKTEYKMIKYKLDPLEARKLMRADIWCICKLYKDGSSSSSCCDMFL